MTDADDRYARLLALLKQITYINAAKNALEWDMETAMPVGAGEARGAVMGCLASLAHAKLTSAEFEDAIAPLADLHRRGLLAAVDPGHAIIGLAWKEFDRARKLPSAFVAELEALCVSSHHVWADAKERSDWSAFLPNLTRIIEMKREEARLVGGGGSSYDALLDRFEPGMTTVKVAAVLDPLAESLAGLVRRIAGSGRKLDLADTRIAAPRDVQHAFSLRIAAAIGFDTAGGCLAEAAHPFMIRLHPGDVRMATRYDLGNVVDGLYSVIHEAGHGMFEQGLPEDLYGTPAGEAPSYGLHESQSRLWENMVGRSLPFVRWLAPQMSEMDAPRGLEPVAFWRSLNAVTPSLVRVDADEVTYNLHICLRFRIERALIEGTLDPKDVPAAWNDGMRDLLGIEVPDDARGALQDVHWSAGAFGYFPSYAVGNLYAAQLYAAAQAAISGLEDGYSRGEFAPLLSWLRRNVHRHGSCMSADDVVRAATGSGLDARPFIAYLERKYAEIYDL